MLPSESTAGRAKLPRPSSSAPVFCSPPQASCPSVDVAPLDVPAVLCLGLEEGEVAVGELVGEEDDEEEKEEEATGGGDEEEEEVVRLDWGGEVEEDEP